jgi:hypothetical protein
MEEPSTVSTAVITLRRIARVADEVSRAIETAKVRESSAGL